MCRTWIRGWSRCARKVLSASLSLVFPAHCLDSALLGGAKARRLKEEKEKVKASNCQICDNAKFHHYYPGGSGNHFTRLRRHLGLKWDIFIKPLTSRFAKAIALSPNFPCVQMVTGSQTWRDSSRAPRPTTDQQWHSQTSSKAPLPRDQAGPACSPRWPLAAPAALTGAAPTSTWPVWLLLAHNSCVMGSQPHSTLQSQIIHSSCFPSPAWHSQLPYQNLPFGCSQDLASWSFFPFGAWLLIILYMFFSRKSTFSPALLEEIKEQDKNSKFQEVFLRFCKRMRAGMQQLGFSLKFCFMKWMF